MPKSAARIGCVAIALAVGACAAERRGDDHPLAHDVPTTLSSAAAIDRAIDPMPLVIVTRDEWGSKPQPLDESTRQTPRIFTIHHAGELWKPTDDAMKKMVALQKYGQAEKHWADVPYHYLIAPDGRVFEGRDWHYQPQSNTNYPLDGVLNIELMGNFEVQRVSIEQLRALVPLLAKLSRDLQIDPATIRGHRDAAVDQTVCPGKDFYRYIHDGLIRRWTEEELAGTTPAIRELPALPDGPTTRIATTLAATVPTR